MEMEDAPGDEIRVTMKVEVNELLKQWIMYYGNIATVQQPKKLRQMILETAKKLVEKYEK
jgi:predicted DNA-binding transcriptional regulator YafY